MKFLRRSNCIIVSRLLKWRLRAWVRRDRARRKHWRIYRGSRESDLTPRFDHRVIVIINTRTQRFHVVSYKPLDPQLRKWPPLLFEGRLRWGDEVPRERRAVPRDPPR